jgi:ribosome biogenesis GTPase A
MSTFLFLRPNFHHGNSVARAWTVTRVVGRPRHMHAPSWSSPPSSGWRRQQQPSSLAPSTVWQRSLAVRTTSRDNDNTNKEHRGGGASPPARKSFFRKKKKKKIVRRKKTTAAPKKKASFTINTKITPAQAADNLAAAFDEMARQEGFDKSLSLFADQDYLTSDDYYHEMAADTGVPPTRDDDGKPVLYRHDGQAVAPALTDDYGDEEEDFVFDQEEDGDEDGEELDFGHGYDPDLSMEDRIQAAKRDMDMGRVSVPEQLDSFAQQATFDELRALGFKHETNPFGTDETPRRRNFQLITNAMTCPACGSDFQSSNEERPGYLPPEKFETQVKLSKIEEMQKLVRRANEEQWSPEDEVEWLIQTGGTAHDNKDMTQDDINIMVDEMGLNLEELAKKTVICKRCHGLQHHGKVDKKLRPGWTKEPLLSQERFRKLLAPLKEKPAVIIALVDIFDFSGSVLAELDEIAGENPVILAANKADLLPPKMGVHRIETWVRRELDYLGVKSIANVGGSVRLISCKTGRGVQDMLTKARELADEMECAIYVVGAANAGKSTLLNHILSKAEKQKPWMKKRAGNQNSRRGAITTSPLPGTTLKFIRVKLEDEKDLYDTPGLLVPGTITQLLTPEELKIVVPTKRVEPITFRLESGKCVMVGGLARVELVGDSRPFLITVFVANTIKLHLTKGEKAEEMLQKFAGDMLTPPLPPGPERMAEIGPFEDHVIDIEGRGWKEAAADISLTGLGWVAVTGCGAAKIKVSVPTGIGVQVRPPLMPFDVWDVASKYTGARSVRKPTRSKTGKRRSGVGRM